MECDWERVITVAVQVGKLSLDADLPLTNHIAGSVVGKETSLNLSAIATTAAPPRAIESYGILNNGQPRGALRTA